MKLAEQRMAEGKYGEAEQIAREIVSDRYDPNCRPAQDLLRHSREPGYFNKTMGPKFIAKVEDVRRLLGEAEGYYQSGRYDLAMKKYDQVLALDPYNVAARRGQERIDLTKTHYGEEAYTPARSSCRSETGGIRVAGLPAGFRSVIRPRPRRRMGRGRRAAGEPGPGRPRHRRPGGHRTGDGRVVGWAALRPGTPSSTTSTPQAKERFEGSASAACATCATPPNRWAGRPGCVRRALGAPGLGAGDSQPTDLAWSRASARSTRRPRSAGVVTLVSDRSEPCRPAPCRARPGPGRRRQRPAPEKA